MTHYLAAHEIIRFNSNNANGALVHGCLFRPQLPNPQGGILIVHDRWGVNRHMLGVTERYAHVGYVTLVVDLYQGKVAVNATEADALANSLQPIIVDDHLRAALRWLRAQPFVKADAVGCVGFGWGNRHALRLVTSTDRSQAIIAFYGYGDDPIPTDALRTPLLGLYGERDETAKTVKQLRATLSNVQHSWEIVSYPGADYGFFDEFSPAFRFNDAEDAWSRSNKFFYRYLGEPM